MLTDVAVANFDGRVPSCEKLPWRADPKRRSSALQPVPTSSIILETADG